MRQGVVKAIVKFEKGVLLGLDASVLNEMNTASSTGNGGVPL